MSEMLDNLNQQADLRIGLPDPEPKPRAIQNPARALPQAEPPVDAAERDALRKEVKRLKTELALREESMSQTEMPTVSGECHALQREIENLQRTVADREADIAELRVAARLSEETPPAPGPRPDQQVEIVRLTGILEESGAVRRDLETQVARLRKTENGQKERIEILQAQLAEAQHNRNQHSDIAARATATNTRLEQDLKNAAEHIQQREQQWDQVLREQDARERRLRNQMETIDQELAAVRQQIPDANTGIQRETTILRARLLEEEQRAADLDAISQRIHARQTNVIAVAIFTVLVFASLSFFIGRRFPLAPTPTLRTQTAAVANNHLPPPTSTVASAVVQPEWPAIAVPGVQTRPTPDTLTLLFDNGIFSSGAKLGHRAQTSLKALAQPLAAAKQFVRIEVQGCTDAQGSSTHNRALAQQRADVVREFLVRETGLPAAAVTAIPAAAPPYPGVSPDADRKNRTVVIVVRRG